MTTSAVELQPLIEQALAHFQNGRYADAAHGLDRVLETAPRHARALHLRGAIASTLGDLQAALPLLAAAVREAPLDADPRCDLATAQYSSGDPAAAEAGYLQALQLQPDHANALYNLGNLYKDRGRNAEALRCYVALFSKDPAHVSAWNNAGVALLDMERAAEATRCFEQALAIDGDFAPAYANLGRALHEQGLLGRAIDTYRRGVARFPERALLRANLGGALATAGDHEEAVGELRRALDLDPANATARASLIFALDFDEHADVAEQQAERRAWYAHCMRPLGIGPLDLRPAAADLERKLRIGYVSGDFSCTSAAACFSGLILAYDRSAFEVYCYATRRIVDGLTQRFSENTSAWRDISAMKDAEAARLIADDRIDILVDLSGHMRGNRLGIFAYRPAPIQMTGWGYACGTGMPEIDYLFADRLFMPAEFRRHLTEQVIDLPCVIAYTPFETPPPITPLPALRNGHLTFGCFNRLPKITARSIRLWSMVLRALPDARLIVKTSSEIADESMDALLARFAAHGIAAERLALQQRTLWYAHLETIAGVDIMLDPFPHGGGVSLLEGLLMGVPSIALKGATPASRLSTSLLHQVGLDHLAGDDDAAYVATAVRLAGDLRGLADLRSGLRERLLAAPVCAPQHYLPAVEAAYRAAWRRRSATATAADGVAAPDAATALHVALSEFQAGRLSETAITCRGILRGDPDNAHASFLLGLALAQDRHPADAAAAFREAIRVDRRHAGYPRHLACALDASGDRDGAIAAYRDSLTIDPAQPDVLNNLGIAVAASGELAAAIGCYEQAVALKPDFAEAFSNLGNALASAGRPYEALAAFERALATNPDLADAHANAARVHNDLGDHDAAIAACHRALALHPDSAAALCNLGDALRRRGAPEAACEKLRQALAVAPELADAWFSLGHALADLGDYESAVAAYRRAAELRPTHAEAWCNLAAGLQSLGRLAAAADSLDRALRLRPDYAEALANRGLLFQVTGRLPEAMRDFRAALAIDARFIDAHSNLIFTMDLADDVDAASRLAERRRWEAAHAAGLPPPAPWPNSADPDRPLRIGYVSADFRRHSAATAFGAMLTEFDGANFEVYAYSNTRLEDDLSRRFEARVTGWRRIVGLADDAVADRIRADQIDILIDLSGHSAGNRLPVFARRPAPVQATGWGYAAGTGLAAIDYLLTDPVVVPPDERDLYVEAPVYLPNMFSGYFADAFPDTVAAPASAGGRITFGSLNRLAKLTPPTLAAWARILHALPESRLLLKTAELDDAATRAALMAHFAAAGIAAERLTLLGKTGWTAHVAAFNRVDVALDPFPHGGGVTTIESVAMGVPVVTLRWPSIAGRLSASILTTLDLADWIADSADAYVALALAKAQEVAALGALRQELRPRLAASPIGDHAAYARAVEARYRESWRRWCAKPRAS